MTTYEQLIQIASVADQVGAQIETKAVTEKTLVFRLEASIDGYNAVSNHLKSLDNHLPLGNPRLVGHQIKSTHALTLRI